MSPETPPANGTWSSLSSLLARFGAARTPTSVTKARQFSLATDGNVSNTPGSQTVQTMSLDPCSPITISSSASSTAAQSWPEESISEGESIDELQSEAAPTLEELASRRSRPLLVRGAKFKEGTLIMDPYRRSSGRVKLSKENKILSSDSPTHKQNSVVLPKKTAPLVSKTARNMTRSEIARCTKPKQDAFFHAHRDLFLPLLPTNNYIAKLGHNENLSTPIPYEELEMQPEGVTATMKPYQLTGLSFLVYLHRNGMSGLLGDEMGLGKTLQTLSLFQFLEEQDKRTAYKHEEPRPYLVVCPLSVLGSWIAEARKWTPALKVLRFHGNVTEREKLKHLVADAQSTQNGNSENNHDGSYNVIVTTYETFAAEKTWLRSVFVWRYVVLDEGHKVKNHRTIFSAALQAVSAEHRLILTGTPLQNDLRELWSLLHWLYPDVFTENSSELFKKSFNLSKGVVDSGVMDDSRKLLELVMLRRVKDSEEVNLGLPEKTEILLHVPLAPMQRFWYKRLLTGAGNNFLDEIFRDAGAKDIQQAVDDSKQWSQLEEAVMKAQEDDQWKDSRDVMHEVLEKERAESKTGAWRRLMNLIMRLRMCCSHPYLLAGAAPDTYDIGQHLVQASGKFIVLEKLLKHLAINSSKKILIFSGFTVLLDLVEELLAYMDNKGDSIKYLRFDGGTCRARRNLAIRLFNDAASDHRVMLLSLKAGGLGINLTSAANVIFLDEDWNPQITLQAEARAHRIGQTQPVTIYKLYTSGTVEQQMMGRIRKKLFLSAKITESMRNVHSSTPMKPSKGKVGLDDAPQLGLNQLKSLIRRGAQTLSHPEVHATEMLEWDYETILAKCRDTPTIIEETAQNLDEPDTDEQKWLSQMEKVECAIFEGEKHTRTLKDGRDTEFVDLKKEDRRHGKNTTVIVDGFEVSKASIGCGEWEAVPTLVGKGPRLAEPVREKKKKVTNQDHCHSCMQEGGLNVCAGCPRSYHEQCLDEKSYSRLHQRGTGFYCSQHQCVECTAKTGDAGGMLYRCRWCPRAYCEDCLDFRKTALVGDTLKEFEMLAYAAATQAYYIVCPDCYDRSATDKRYRALLAATAAAIDRRYDDWLASTPSLDRPRPTSPETLPSAGLSSRLSSVARLSIPGSTSGTTTATVSEISTPTLESGYKRKAAVDLSHFKYDPEAELEASDGALAVRTLAARKRVKTSTR